MEMKARKGSHIKKLKSARPRQVCRAVAQHPKTGETVFFNQVQLHHISCLEPSVRQSLLAMFREEV